MLLLCVITVSHFFLLEDFLTKSTFQFLGYFDFITIRVTRVLPIIFYYYNRFVHLQNMCPFINLKISSDCNKFCL